MFLIMLVLAALQEKPGALLALEQARVQIYNIDVWYKVHTPDGPEPYYWRSVITAEGDRAYFNEGTVAGVVGVDEAGKALPVRPYASLRTREASWTLYEESLVADFNQEPEDARDTFFDPRTIGVVPNPKLFRSVQEALWSSSGVREYKQEQLDDGTWRVEGREDSGRSIVWYIDPQRGWNATRSELYLKGQKTLTCEVEFQRTNSVWFPSRCSYVLPDGSIPQSFEVLDIELNTREIPDRLTPDVIGVYSGTHVKVYGDTEDVRLWDGSRLCTRAEWRAALAEGKASYDPRVQAMIDRQLTRARRRGAPADEPGRMAGDQVATTQGAVSTAPVTDAWAKYTYDFIATYHLNDDQTATALRILKRCQERRDRCLRSAEGKESSPKRETDRLGQRVVHIFERVLKPGLEKIPTRAQIEAADAPRSSSDAEGAWALYTREFIANYRLNQEQSEKALRVLRECQDRANEYLKRHKTELDEAEKAIPQARDEGARKDVREKLGRLQQPITDIFERELKPRLEKLPTRAQREAAEASTQPAKPTP